MSYLFKFNIFAFFLFIHLLNPRLSLQHQNTLLTQGATPSIAAKSNTGKKPIAKFDYTPLGTSGIVTFIDLSENNPTYWRWDFGNGLGSNKRNPEMYFYSSGIHTIQLIVLNEFGSDTISMDILVNLEYPETAFSYTIVEGTGLVHFKDESSNFPFFWTWVFGDGEESYLQNPTHQYKKSGNYDVLLSAANGKGNRWTIPKTIKITIDGTKPIANFKYAREQESGRINFTDLSENEPTTWKWDFGDGTTSNEQNPTHQFLNPGDYQVQLIAENKHGIDVIKLPVSVVLGEAPVSKFEYTNLEGTLEVNFTDNSENGPTSWFWDFGDGNTSNQQNPSHLYQNPGNYKVKLFAANEFGMNTYAVSVSLTFAQAPKAAFDYSITEGSSVINFSDQSKNDPIYWFWDFGDGNTSIEQNPTHQFLNPGTFEILLVVENQFGKDSTTTSINIGPPPIALFGYSINQESGLVTFSDQSKNDPSTWLWNFGDGNTSTEQNPTYQYQNSGNYEVKLIASNQFGSDALSLTTKIIIPSSPNAKFTYAALKATGKVSFTDQSDHYPTAWFWDFGDGITSIEQNPTHQYQKSDTFNLLFYAANKYGIDSTSRSIAIQIGQTPVAGFDYQISDVSTGEVTFSDQSEYEPTQWLWDFGDGNSSTEQNPTYIYQKTGDYTVRLTAINQFGSTNTNKQIKVTVGQPPVAKFDYTLSAESGQINFTDLTENEPNNWLWDFGDGNTSTLQHPSHLYLNSGNYTVKLIASNDYGQNASSKEVSFVRLVPPNAKFDYNINSESGKVSFIDLSENGPTNWLWDFGDGNSSTQQNPTYQYQNSGSYIVKLVAANNIGIGTSETEIDLTVTDIKKLPDGASLLIFPNPFSEQLIFNISNMENQELLLKIFNISGHLIQSRKLNSKIEIETSQWSKGAYIYQLSNKKGEIIATGKLIK